MSHTWEHGKSTFTGNSDLSGELTITVDDIDFGQDSITMPFSDVVEFVVGRIRSARISQIEQASDTDIILGKM